LILIGILLFLMKTTGLGAHIAISIVGVLALGVYTSLTKKEWKIPALEVLMRLFYGIALIIGIVLMNVHGIAALALVHKICCGLFMALVVVLFVTKLATKKEK
jgi:hypothetical protein